MIRVALYAGHALVCIKGRGTYKVSSSLKRFAATAIDQGITEFVVDMHDCDHMDSTFMGVLAGVALRLQRVGSGNVRMINLLPSAQEALRTVGIDDLLVACEATQIGPGLFATCRERDGEQLEEATASDGGTLETMLQAHEDLVAASPDNAAQFTDVITFLKQAGRADG
ncbi:MAG: STAS domain-containing protein [Verrucomicrobia bacterium]|nr:STAS domain-containing protein [Verrucomicrobiota bacterium]MDA1085775.1 STAS domain-containing protein [Verrucomicrobiota bacterium]